MASVGKQTHWLSLVLLRHVPRRRKASRGVFHLASEICAIDLRERLKTRSTRAQAEAQLRAADQRLRASANELDAVRERKNKPGDSATPPRQSRSVCF